MQTTKITNPSSSYFGEDCRVIQHLAEEKVEVFLLSTEMLICIPLSDIAQKERTYRPKSRKDFYEFIKNPKTSRADIKNAVEEMIKHKKITPQKVSPEALAHFFDTDTDKDELVEGFRKLRDEGGFEFNLENNHVAHHPGAKKFHHNDKHKRSRSA